MSILQTIYNSEPVILQTIYQADNSTLSSIYDVSSVNNTTAIEGFFSSTEVEVTGSGTLSITAGQLVEKIIMTTDTSGAFKMGTSANGSEIGGGNLIGGTAYVRQIDYYFPTAGTLHFTGNFTAYVYLR